LYYALGILVLFGVFYALGKLESKRRKLYFRNVLKIFNIEKEIIINEKTKLQLSEPVPYGDTYRYDISVMFEDVVVEKRTLSEKLNKDEPVSFRGPWKQDIYKALRSRFDYYTHPSRTVQDNVVKMKSKKEIYADRYKRYVATRDSAYN